MQIVVNIPEDVLGFIYTNGFIKQEDRNTVNHAILECIELPKKHGRLIDADALEKKMCDREKGLGDDRALWESSAVSIALDMFAPTIIEAESEDNE